MNHANSPKTGDARDQRLRASRAQFAKPGPAWQIALDLREVADPVRPLSWVNLRGSFQPNQGALVKTSEEPRLIQIGRGS